MRPTSSPPSTRSRARGLRISASRRQVLAMLYADPRPGPPRSSPAAATSPRSTATSTRSRRSASSATSISATAPASTRSPGADIEYVTCERCGAHEASSRTGCEAAKQLIERETGYRPRFTHFPIVGVCPACQEDEGHAHP